MSDTPRTDACEYVAMRRHAYYDRFAIARELERELAAMQAQRDTLADAIRSFATDFEAIPWGFDGDCGAQRLLDHLYESLAAVEGGQP